MFKLGTNKAVLLSKNSHQMPDDLLLKLIKGTDDKYKRILYYVEGVSDSGNIVLRKSNTQSSKTGKMTFEVPLEFILPLPSVGDLINVEGFTDKVEVLHIHGNVVNNHMICISGGNYIRLEEIKSPEPLKETPFEDTFAILNQNLYCKVSKIGWTPKKGNILSVLDYYNNRLLFGGSISEKEFIVEKPIFLTELGDKVIYSLLDNHKRNIGSVIVDVDLGLYDLKIIETSVCLSVHYKRFKNHPKSQNEAKLSLRNFCLEFSEHMIKQ